MRFASATFISAILCAAVACTGSKDKPVEGEATPPQPVTQEPQEPAATQTPEDKEREERKRRVAEGLEKAKTEAEAEKQRWTDEMRAQAAKLVETEHKDAKKALQAILASSHRDPDNAARDPHRHPLETMTFFGIKPDITVLEVGGGGGWYTEILAPLLAKKGKYIVTSANPDGPDDQMSTVYGTRMKLFLESSPELYGKVEVSHVNPDQLELAPAGTVDLAFAIREMHGWQRREMMDKYLAAVFAALKPGGTFGVVQHRAKPDADPAQSAETGYLPEAWLIETVEKAGFKLVEKSEINANPKDTKDYESGVWTLPPNYALGDKDRDKYQAIGESDRMTLKFVKPETK